MQPPQSLINIGSVAVEVIEGNVGDPNTLQSQITKLKECLDRERV